MPTIIFHQAKEYSKDFHLEIPLDWTVHHIPSGYMDRDGWLKSMTQLSNLCGAYPVNNKIIFFNRHDINFEDYAHIHMEHQNIQPLILNEGDSVNDHPNDNGPNAKLKSLYNGMESVWMIK